MLVLLISKLSISHLYFISRQRYLQIKTAYVSSLDKERAMTQNSDILAD